MLDLTTVQCEKPPQPEGVALTYDSLEYGSVIKYECQANYTYVLERNGICDNSGLWTVSPPDCQRESCHIFITGLVLIKSLTIFVYGLTVAYLKTTCILIIFYLLLHVSITTACAQVPYCQNVLCASFNLNATICLECQNSTADGLKLRRTSDFERCEGQRLKF